MVSVLETELPPLGDSLQELTTAYSKYFLFPELLRDGEEDINQATEAVLTRMDEFGALIETVRSVSTAECRAKVIYNG